ncbi:MAG TPA: hypothetical protein PKE64_08425 [Anaerolineae bacterium]|nr:hypothetical protein [Anaerolineae bacterium]
MLQLSEEFSAGNARLRIDIYGSRPLAHVLDEMTFLNYRLAEVQISFQVTQPAPDVIWDQDRTSKSVRYEDRVLILEGDWFQGELQKALVSMLALKMELSGLHAFHASAVRYHGQTIMFLGGEANHGKTMSQIEGCRRGGLVVSTETTVTDEQGVAVMGSKNVFLRLRAKGTERADLPNQDQGVAKFFDKTPEFNRYDDPSNVDLVILPAIDGHYDTKVTELIPFEREYQTYHSLMNYFGLNQLLAQGLPMPIIDTDELRLNRANFCQRFCQRRYYLIRAKTPQIIWDEVEKFL